MIPFVREMAFEYGRCDQVSPLIRRVVARNPGPFTFLGTGTYVVGRGEVAVIDPGPYDADHLQAILSALDGERVTTILVTHSHADHSPLARPLAAETGAPVLGLAPPRLHGPVDVVVEAGDDLDYRPDRVLADAERLTGPGWTLTAMTTPGHASDHVCFALAEENALFSGDHVMGWSTTVVSPPDGDMDAYLASLDKVAAAGFATLWPTHGPPVTDPAPFLAAYKAHRLAREAAILERLAAGDRRILEMTPVLYAAVDRRLWPAAARSVLAHMIRLVRSGAVATDGEPGLESEYRLR